MDIQVSVVIPCYNCAAYLKRCVESLINQSTSLKYELIFVNDGSIDETLDILRSYENTYPSCVRVIDSLNNGAWGARAIGVSHAKGEYIAFLDSDDKAQPSFLEELYCLVADGRAELGVCGFCRVDEEGGRVLSKEMNARCGLFSLDSDPGQILSINPAPWNKIFKRELLEGLDDLEISPVMFDDLCMLLFAYGGVRNVAFSSKILVNYYVHKDSLINSASIDQVLDGERSLGYIVSKLTSNRRFSTQTWLEALDSLAFIHVGVSMLMRLMANKSPESSASDWLVYDILDCNYPKWKDPYCLSLRYCLTHGFAYMEFYFCHFAAKHALLGRLLNLYLFLQRALSIELKW